jgi:predicted XRE-type DNA-binding protein
MRLLVFGEQPLYWVGSAKRDLLAFPRSGQRRHWRGTERRSVWRVTPGCEAAEGSGFRGAGGCGGLRQQHVPRCLYRSLPLGRICAALFSEEVTKGHSDAVCDWPERITKSDMAKSIVESSKKVVRSSGNVFADLGFPDSSERQTKVRLAIAINDVVQRRGLSQGKAAELLGINQPKISALSKYRLEGFSMERLMRFLTSLNQDIEIIIRSRPRARRPGRLFVTAA